jgi:hypothetical protein
MFKQAAYIYIYAHVYTCIYIYMHMHPFFAFTYIGESWDEQLQLTALKVIEFVDSHKANTNVDWDWVSKQVVMSEPPRLLDVPAHAKFCQHWGGGKRQQLTLETLDFINSGMPVGRIVSGAFFEKLVAIKVTPTEHESMAMFVHACVLANAVGPKDRENIGITVTEQHVKTISTSNRAASLEAGKIIQRAKNIVKEKEAVSGIDLPTRQLVCDLMLELVYFIFKISDKYSSIGGVSNAFVGRLLGHPAASSHEKGANPASVQTHADLIEVDSMCSNAGRLTVASEGFAVSGLVEPKKPQEIDEQYEITYINDDGSVGLSRVMQDGLLDKMSVKAVRLDDLIKNFKHCRTRIELLEGYVPPNS